MAAELYLDLVYDLKRGKVIIAETNIKGDCIDNILETCASMQVGRGEDKSKAVEKDFYRIRMKVDLSCDDFYVSSDTNNKGLTLGIVMNSISKWKMASELDSDDAMKLAWFLEDNNRKH